MKLKYTLNQLNEYVAYDLVADDYEAGELETCVPMPNGLYEPVRFNPINQTWSGATREEWLDNQPTPKPVVPSAGMLAINALGLQVAKLMAEKGGN